MQFMMLMIPSVYRNNTQLDPGFVPEPKKIEEMTRFNDTGARVSFGEGKPTVTDGPFIDIKK